MAVAAAAAAGRPGLSFDGMPPGSVMGGAFLGGPPPGHLGEVFFAYLIFGYLAWLFVVRANGGLTCVTTSVLEIID